MKSFTLEDYKRVDTLYEKITDKIVEESKKCNCNPPERIEDVINHSNPLHMIYISYERILNNIDLVVRKKLGVDL